MKHILLLIFFGLITNLVLCQNNLGNADDDARIALNIFIPEQIENIPAVAKSLLNDRVTQILTNYSLSGSNQNGRFILLPTVSVIEKYVTSTIPSMIVLSLQISLYVGDGFQGIKFSTTSFSLKGVGQNETKAYEDAFEVVSKI